MSVLSKNLKILRPVSQVRLKFPLLSFAVMFLLMHSALAINCSSRGSEKVRNPVREHVKSFHRESIFVFKIHTTSQRKYECRVQKSCLVDARRSRTAQKFNFELESEGLVPGFAF